MSDIPTHDDLAELSPADELDLLEALQQHDRALAAVQEAETLLAQARKALVSMGVNLERLEGGDA